jgi:hypothetical protein
MFIRTILRNKNRFFSSSDKRSIITAIEVLNKRNNVKSPPPPIQLHDDNKLIQELYNGLSKVISK